MTGQPICPCDAGSHPKTIVNPPGLGVVDYRVGDFTSFRHALLQAQPGETWLRDWRPGASGDLALQMVEWWAYVSDVLTFYNWRILSNGLLRSADEPESVGRIVRLLGYRPNPGLGATGLVALVADGSRPVAVPRGFQLLSKPAPGKTPQTFEVDAALTLAPPTDLVVLPEAGGLLFDAGGALTLAGAREAIKAGDGLLLAPTSGIANAAWVTVSAVEFTRDMLGALQTRVLLDPVPALAKALARDYQLLRGLQNTPFWHFGDGKPKSPATPGEQAVLHCTGLVRPSNAGERVLVRIDGRAPVLTAIASSSDTVWWRNDADAPNTPPATGIALPVLHSRLGLSPAVSGTWDDTGNIVFDWRRVGELVGAQATTLSGPGGTVSAVGAPFPPLRNATVVLEDAAGQSAAAIANTGATGAGLALSGLPAASFAAPFVLHLGVAPVSRGFSVADEVLGSGDATRTQQEFRLKKAPVTYLAGESRSGDGYRSTVRVWVDGVEYHEVPTLYGQPQGARVFATREDEAGYTHVRFAGPLPTGIGNLVASYRIERGAAVPGPGDIAIITRPQAGILKAVASTIVTPGRDPDPPEQLRKLAPLSVLTFGRAVSGDDYEAIAALAPGVARVKSYYGWDQGSQRAAVKLYVGDTAAALAAARDAIGRASDPNRPAEILPAQPVPCSLQLSLFVRHDHVYAEVEARVRAALLDPERGLFGAARLGIGQSIFASQVIQACMAVAGVKAIHGFAFSAQNLAGGPRFDPGEGGYFVLPAQSLNIVNGDQYGG